MDKPLKKHGVSAPEWKLLGLIYDTEEILATEVALFMDVKLPLVTRNVSTLKKKGFIIVKSHQEDKRAKWIAISRAGEKKLIEIDTDVRRAIGAVFKTATKHEFDAYKTVLEKIIQNRSSC